MLRGHFHHDDERGDRRLGHTGEESAHSQNGEGHHRRLSQLIREHLPQARAHRQRGRQQTRRNAAQIRHERGECPGRSVTPRQVRVVLEDQTRLIVAGAVGQRSGKSPESRDQQPAEPGEEGGVLAAQALQAKRQPLRAFQGEQAEQSTAQTAGRSHHQDLGCDPGGERGHLRLPEIGVVPHERDRGHAREDHGGERRAACALLERARQLLDGEHDACERRVERGRDACGAAREHQRVALAREPPAGHQSAHAVHDHGTDMHRRPLTADRAAAEQAGACQQHAADDHLGPQEHLTHFARVRTNGEDGLGNPAALGAAEIAAREPRDDEKSHGREHPRRPGCDSEEALQTPLRNVRNLGEGYRGRADRAGCAPHQQARLPVSIGQ